MLSRGHRQARSESRAVVLPLAAGCPMWLLTSSVPGASPARWAARGMEGSRGPPWEIFNYRATCVQLKPDTSDNASGLDVILQKMDLSSADVS